MKRLSRRILFTGIILLLLAAFDLAIQRFRIEADLTAEESQTLARQTREIVGQVDEPIAIAAFLGRDDPDRVTASSLLIRYRRLNRRISFRLVDPVFASGEALRFGINPAVGGVAVSRGDRVELAQTATELDLTAAIARLERGGPRLACYVEGHGEADPESSLGEGAGQMIALLLANGYEVQTLDLLTRSQVPDDCAGVILANPTAPLGSAEEIIAGFLAGGGRALILADPVSNVDLNPILEPYGISIERGIVLEGDRDLRFPDDPTRPVIFDYRSPSPIVRRLPPVFFPGVQALETKSDLPSGLTATVIASTSEDSYLERRPLEPSFDEGQDIQGPLAVVASADLSENLGSKVRRTRIVVFADADFATNSFLGEAGNSTLLLRALDWAALEDDLVAVSVNLPSVRPLDLTEGRLGYARLLLAGAVPGLYFIGGLSVWAARRRK